MPLPPPPRALGGGDPSGEVGESNPEGDPSGSTPGIDPSKPRSAAWSTTCRPEYPASRAALTAKKASLSLHRDSSTSEARSSVPGVTTVVDVVVELETAVVVVVTALATGEPGPSPPVQAEAISISTPRTAIR